MRCTNNFVLLVFLVLGFSLRAAFSEELRSEELRKVIRLDGIWEVAEGSWDKKPETFRHRVPVPGLLDMADPRFPEVGTKNSRQHRSAFWYRRTFRLEGPVPPLVRLKINKAKYGKKIFLNGHFIGEHWPCFTPCVFDITSRVRGNGEENELIIVVGADRQSLPPGIPDGWDFEKSLYIPGIYDSVMLWLSGDPHIVRAQIVPHVGGGSVRLFVTLRSLQVEATTPITVRIREASTGKVVAEASLPDVPVEGQETEFTLEVPIPGCRLWSPEDPFLYEAVVSTSGDTFRHRFGMREFRFDPATRRPMLNGRFYPLRGTNVCIFRFFEDPLRADLPWREDWVRRLHTTFKSMHWNAIRYCIGFPPERWYDIADEVGLLIQDEFPIWYLSQWPKELTWRQLVKEYTDWIDERCNHPCVIIWDAQNETRTDQTGKAIQVVRVRDRSNRPWDNGWSPPQSPNDVFESHPYPFYSHKGEVPSKFRLSHLAAKPREPDIPGGLKGNAIANTGRNPVIINEYGWLWLNRDGTPTVFSRANYQVLLGPDALPDQRRELYARYIAVMTEFWRSGRQVAGVLHFCGLGYSRPGGETSDNFVDIRNLILEPYFVKYVKDAFAPTIAILDFWAEEVSAGLETKIPVIVLNDAAQSWSGRVRLLVLHHNAPLTAQEQNCSVAELGNQVLTFSLKLPEKPGKYDLVAELTGLDGNPVRSVRQIQILPEPDQKRPSPPKSP